MLPDIWSATDIIFHHLGPVFALLPEYWPRKLILGFYNWCKSHTYICQLLLAQAWFWTCVHWRVTSFLPYDLKFSKFFCFLITLYCLKTCCDVSDLQFICLSLQEIDSLLFTFVSKKPYFPIFHTNYLIVLLTSALANLGCK